MEEAGRTADAVAAFEAPVIGMRKPSATIT